MAIPESFEGRCGECLLFGGIQGLSDGLVLTDPPGRIVLVNREAETLLGVDGKASRGLLLGMALAAHPALRSLWDAAGEEDFPGVDVELREGRVHHAAALVCRGAGGGRIGRALLLHDVTAEKTIQVQLAAPVARRLLDLAGGETALRPLPDLTRREREILALLGEGLGNKEIAARLRVSPNTVTSHLKHLYVKLRVANRAQAASVAAAHGIRPAVR